MMSLTSTPPATAYTARQYAGYVPGSQAHAQGMRQTCTMHG